MRTLLTIVLCVCAASPAFASPPVPPRVDTARIRPQDARVRSLLAEGAARSATFKRLADRIEASHLIVYVGMSPQLKGLAGRLTWMTRAGDYRYVRITISTDLSADMIIATLGHELQHAVEVIEDPTVVDEDTLAALYQRIGRPSRAAASSGWETVDAQEAGHRVRRELVSAPALKATRMTRSDTL